MGSEMCIRDSCDTDITLEVEDNQCTDLDNDGVCATSDCDDQNPLLPAIPNTSCNDGNSQTINDVIQSDGCTCQGQLKNAINDPCSGLFVRTSANTIMVGGLTAPIEVVKLYRINGDWTLIDECIADCSNPHLFTNLAAGAYLVDVQLYDAHWRKLCVRQLEIAL